MYVCTCVMSSKYTMSHRCILVCRVDTEVSCSCYSMECLITCHVISVMSSHTFVISCYECYIGSLSSRIICSCHVTRHIVTSVKHIYSTYCGLYCNVLSGSLAASSYFVIQHVMSK